MSAVTSAFAPAHHPRDTLLDRHLSASVLMAVYLIIGCALAMLSVMGLWMNATQQLSATLSTLAYAMTAATPLWFGLGAWVMQQHQRKLQASNRRYDAYVQRHAITAERVQPATPVTTAPDVKGDTDAPWELQAFWGTARPLPAAMPTAAAPLNVVAHSAAMPTARQHSRPVSLFGMYQ